MKDAAVRHLVCPECRGDLTLRQVKRRPGGFIDAGELVCDACRIVYPIVNGIPRFVSDDNYASGFGLEWSRHARTQYDSYSGIDISERRFFDETRWSRGLPGEMILEVGSGSGRFTEHAASTGAFVVSMDYSNAVEANYASNGEKANVLIVQADVYAMPFRHAYFDKVVCIGVLQHTPDVRRAFQCLGPAIKPGGEVVVDVYPDTFSARWWATKTYVRPFTRRMNPAFLYRLVIAWTNFMWPLARLVRRIPYIGVSINWHLLIADYSRWGLRDDIAREWAYLDAFDMLSPRFDSPQTLVTIRRWFAEDGYLDVDVCYGYNGIEGRGRRPPSALVDAHYTSLPAPTVLPP